MMIIVALMAFSAYAQKAPKKVFDTVLITPAYKSYFSYQLREPVFVSYILRKGGGPCDRTKFRFKNDTKIPMEGDAEYSRSGYDKGHLANAEDFANDCQKDEQTFRYYNCLPQTPNMNRGIWKMWETSIRKESHEDSLLVICGGIWSTDKHVNGMAIPTHCWKVVYSFNKKVVKHVLFFTNETTNSTVKEMKLHELEEKLGYKLPLTF